MELKSAQQAGQVLIAGFSGEDAPAEVCSVIERGELGGVILFKRNVGTNQQVAVLNARLASLAPAALPLLLAVDQEGGRVTRLKEGVIDLPPMRVLGDLDDIHLTRRLAQVLGTQLAALGFTIDFAPVTDVDSNPQNPAIGDRSFASEPSRVARHALAFADGLSAGGVMPCIKHFPGHGDTDVDSHLALPIVRHDRARIDRIELAPFAALTKHVPFVMTAHVVFEALDPGVPASLSKPILQDLLRAEMGFEGVVVSDDLEMKAIAAQMSIGEAACRAIEAGCDALLVCSQWNLVLEAKEALAHRAESDATFRARLADAADRFVRARRTTPPRPVTEPSKLEAVLCSREAAEAARILTQSTSPPARAIQ